MGDQRIPFKMFGLQRTCTNLVKFALERSYQVNPMEEGCEWKHGRIGMMARREWNGRLVRIIFCVRNPYAWMRSCYRYFRQHKGADGSICEEFSEEDSFGRFVVSPHYEWPSPVYRWNEMNAHWLQFVDAYPERGIVVRAEDLMGTDQQVRQMERIRKHFGLVRNGDRIHAFGRRINNVNRTINVKMDFEHYNQEIYLSDYDEGILAFVNERLVWDLMKRFGYERRGAAELRAVQQKRQPKLA